MNPSRYLSYFLFDVILNLIPFRAAMNRFIFSRTEIQHVPDKVRVGKHLLMELKPLR
jgi:hypothetical protein